MLEALTKRRRAVVINRNAICEDLLKTCSAEGDTAKQEMIEPNELKSEIVVSGSAAGGHGLRQAHYVGVDPKCNIAAGRVTVRKMAVLVGKDGTKGVPPKTVECCSPDDENTFSLVLHFRSKAPAF